MVERGVQWHVGRVFFGETLAYQFDLLPEAGHHRPAFINLQQYHVEAFLLERARALPGIDLRWRNRVARRAAGRWMAFRSRSRRRTGRTTSPATT